MSDAMPDTPTFHVVNVPSSEQHRAKRGWGSVVYPEPTDMGGRRALLVYLDDLPAPGEMGETETGGKRVCHTVWVGSDGDVAARSRVGRTLTRRAPPEPTWQEALETLRKIADRQAREAGVQNGREAIAVIEKRLAGGSDG